MSLFPWFLFAHILGAVIAFGPTFSFPIIGVMGGRERMHANFATRVSERISHIQVLPFAILQGITGLGLVVTGNFDLFATRWLLLAIVLYLIAIGYAIFVQTPTVHRVIEMTSGGPPAGAPPAGAPPAGAPPAGAPPAGGPPPELMGLIQRVQRGGMLLLVLVVTIVFLMVLKPF
jgi:hypothetical protein